MPFNDSNTSEFDEDFGGDSRQDTSLDCMLQQAGRGFSSQQSGVFSSNEQVLDSDLRQANRLNLELALLQSIGGTYSSPLGQSPALRRSVRSRSSIGAPGHQHHFPQSGFLAPASEYACDQAKQQALFSAPSTDPHHQSVERKSSEDDDSGVCGTSVTMMETTPDESRRSSCISASQTAPGSTGCTEHSATTVGSARQQHQQLAAASMTNLPSVRIEIVKRRSGDGQTDGRSSASRQAGVDNDRRTTVRSAGILSSLASTIGRSRSSDSPTPPPRKRSDHESQLYQISIIEAKNILRRRQQQANEWPQPSARNPSSRRDSFLGALVAAATSAGGQQPRAHQSPSSKRRAWLEGCVFARVFKQASDTSPVARQQQRQDQSQQPDCISLHSFNGQLQTAEYLQLPLVKIPTESDIQEGQLLDDGIKLSDINFSELAQDGSYSFTCRADEFPLRLSIYLAAGKRGQGARCTLGHCVLSLDDLRADDSDRLSARQQPVPLPISSWKFVALSNESKDDHDEELRDKWLLDYRLHQTILEAIKCTV